MIEQLIGQTLAGKYLIEQLLRADSSGKTFRATHVLMEKSVAVKVLNQELATDSRIVADFQQEAKLLSRISHPHVLGVTDYGVDDSLGLPFLVMENFDGRTLKDLIREEGALSLERAVLILSQVADALGAAHDAGVVHGALRSSSILLTGNNSRDWIKVVDFDAANKTSDEERANVETASYLSPEQCRVNAAESDARSDIYALGIILYESLTARLPFAGADAAEIMNKHEHEIPPSLLAIRYDFPPSLEQVVQRSLAKNPAQRFQSAADFSAALTRAAEGAPAFTFRDEETILRPRPETEAAAADTANESRWRTAFIVLAGISLLSAGLFFFTQNRRTTPPTDPNSSPVQPINPATGTSEQNLSDFTNLQQFNGAFDGNITPVPPGGAAMPPSDIPYGGRIPPGLYGNQQMYIDPNGGSQFMPDLNANVTIPGRNANLANANRPLANANLANTRPANTNQANTTPANTNPAPTPAPNVQPSPAATPRTTPRTTPPPANRNPIPKPTAGTTEKSAQSLSERVSE